MRLCDQCHAAQARYLVPDLDLAFCGHHWEEVKDNFPEFKDYQNEPILESV